MLFAQPTTQHLRGDTEATDTAARVNSGNRAFDVGVRYDVKYTSRESSGLDSQQCDIYFPILDEHSQLRCITCVDDGRATCINVASTNNRLVVANTSWRAWGCTRACLSRQPRCTVCNALLRVLPPGDALPVVLVVHGGGWKRGSRRYICGLHGNVGRSLAARGFVAVVASYRLSELHAQDIVCLSALVAVFLGVVVAACLAAQGSAQTPSGAGYIAATFLAPVTVGCVLAVCRAWPWAGFRCGMRDGSRRVPACHPDHVHDVAAALMWTTSSVAAFGGDPRNVALLGHSAGAHMLAMLLVGGVPSMSEEWSRLIQR